MSQLRFALLEGAGSVFNSSWRHTNNHGGCFSMALSKGILLAIRLMKETELEKSRCSVLPNSSGLTWKLRANTCRAELCTLQIFIIFHFSPSGQNTSCLKRHEICNHRCSELPSVLTNYSRMGGVGTSGEVCSDLEVHDEVPFLPSIHPRVSSSNTHLQLKMQPLDVSRR